LYRSIQRTLPGSAFLLLTMAPVSATIPVKLKYLSHIHVTVTLWIMRNDASIVRKEYSNTAGSRITDSFRPQLPPVIAAIIRVAIVGAPIVGRALMDAYKQAMISTAPVLLAAPGPQPAHTPLVPCTHTAAHRRAHAALEISSSRSRTRRKARCAASARHRRRSRAARTMLAAARRRGESSLAAVAR
jgi:hypothetical protein